MAMDKSTISGNNNMKPIAPPEVAVAEPVAPPNVAQPAPVGVESGAVSVPDAEPTNTAFNTDFHLDYEDAASRGDPVSIYSLSARMKGTPYEEPVKKIAVEAKRREEEFKEQIRPIAEAGGVQTPEGRVKAADKWETIADNPQKMRAFVEWLAGSKDFLKYVTGGKPTTQVKYDMNGNPIEHTFNELGQTISVVDMGTKKPLSPAELKARGGMVPSLENAIGYQQAKEQSKFNVEALNAGNAAANTYSAAAKEQRQLYSELDENLKKLQGVDLTPEQRKAIGSFTTRTMGFSQSINQGINALSQYIDNKNVSLNDSQKKSLKSALDALGFRMDASGSVINGKNEAVTKTDLQQAQKTLGSSENFERGFNQSKEDFLRSEVFKNLGEKEMQILGRALDIQGRLEKQNLDLSQKHGSLPFLINPKTYQIGDEFSRGRASALIGQFNADASEAYAAWRKEQLDRFPAGTVPKAGELEDAFTRTAIYKNLRAEYAERNKQILQAPIQTTPSTPENTRSWSDTLGVKPTEQPKESVGVKPKQESAGNAPEGYRAVGKTPDGRTVYQTPDGKKVVEKK